jgi:hypothetical protein
MLATADDKVDEIVLVYALAHAAFVVTHPPQKKGKATT